MKRRPEILAPAGDERSIQAALTAGADAVYFGLEGSYNARAKSIGVARDQLSAVVRRCHYAGVRAYVTLNTLIFESELEEVTELIVECAQAGVDALIVQDPSVALIARHIAPTLEVHASTQMTISSPEGAVFAQALGATRAVVPRELSLSQIQRFARQSPIELEVFIHGALCMSWSGQCLTSEAWGGRSANRGQCAQSCRMPYDLIVDGVERPLGEVRYLLSPKDLAGFRAVEGLTEVGVHCLKIEGRYKGPAYVAQTVKSYRDWLDVIDRGESDTPQAREALNRQLTQLSLTYSRGFGDGFLGGADHQTLVEGRFPKHRGVFLGWVEGAIILDDGAPWVIVRVDGDGRVDTGGVALDPSDRPRDPNGPIRDSLPLLGGVEGGASGAGLSPLSPKAGMGVVFDAGDPEGPEAGGRLYSVASGIAPEIQSARSKVSSPTRASKRTSRPHYREERASQISIEPLDLESLATLNEPLWSLRLVNAEALSTLRAGQRVWVNHAPDLAKKTQRASEGEVFGRLPISLSISGQLGRPLTVHATLDHRGALGHRARNASRGATVSARVESRERLVEAKGEGLTRDLLLSKLCAFGQTPLSLDADHSLTVELPPGLHLPVSSLKQLRRTLTQALLNAIDEEQAHPQTSLSALDEVLPISAQGSVDSTLLVSPASPLLVPLCRNLEQLDAVIASGLPEVELDWMEFIGLTQAVERARAFGLRVVIATVRVQKPGKAGYDRKIASLKPDGVLIRHWGALTHFKGLDDRPTLHGDFSLNISNSLSARYVLDYGLDTFTVSHDLNADQLRALIARVPRHRVGVTLHHHIPTFHTEHCVYAHLLSRGRDSRTCGKPCESHKIALRDHKGQEHPVLVDVECQNTIFNASAQTAATLGGTLIDEGIGRLRVEFVWETRAQAERVIQGYQALLSGGMSPQDLVKHVGVHEQFGLTKGTMQVSR